ncbi:MAG: hypothetical protein JWM16_2293 [Verrucomicrobiales bacterium]|nr:hypothetical protein [Verrucomicrobiales bacterium]
MDASRRESLAGESGREKAHQAQEGITAKSVGYATVTCNGTLPFPNDSRAPARSARKGPLPPANSFWPFPRARSPPDGEKETTRRPLHGIFREELPDLRELPAAQTARLRPRPCGAFGYASGMKSRGRKPSAFAVETYHRLQKHCLQNLGFKKEVRKAANTEDARDDNASGVGAKSA